ncbi:SET and MYND domain-containing protein (SMYD)-like protein [Euroglyphus maynei]|uniref:SET and MYND domain-containing protein (SMYD)-like protein n=1 Tax=Euroglyphus maynei TaxID=6958 RepID=A0A1Y3BDJ8_EURMA|nr:SET and MYND domain-containing protein (SMYD)-like protein [Euroglyphus maynei]
MANNSVKFSINHDAIKGRCLIATETIHTGEIIFEELPLVCSQFLWNAECKYDACQFCLTPLETAEENVSRLTKEQIKLPYFEQCCQTNKSKHVDCLGCGQKERYCSIECRQHAFEIYHQTLCYSRSEELANNLNKLCDLWKSIHYPPETASIMLLVKILARIKQDSTFIQKLQQFSKNCERLVANNPDECEQINQLVETLFEKMEKISGCFLNTEGSGLYELQSCINHSCQPNSEVCFLHNNFILSLKALETINPGEEITICYLDECWRDRSRHSRNKYIRENYLFTCQCPKCQQQMNDPDVTSDEDDDSDLQSNPDDDEAMNCD